MKKTNGAGHVQTQTIGPNTSALAGEHSKKPSNVLILPSSDSYTQSSAQLFETSTSSQKLKKIGRLNDALMDINPSYKPVGFSITSLASCSPNVLEDAVEATETAVSTLMSVIAPGEEAFLWEAIKKRLDKKLKDNEDVDRNHESILNEDSGTESEKKNASAHSL